ncbi:MAG: hypothetical protein M3Y87_08485 [Myxococcota bacterium]|nr:hypothetical protein [Myxococcota bacterium]
MTRALSIAMVLVLAACGGGSGDGDAGHGAGGACDEIVEHCHSVGSASAEADACHELGHDGPVASCEARRAECVAICDAVAEDAGPPDACETISHTCHAFDTGSGPAHECHELGHASDVGACEAALAGCLMTCSGDAGAHHHDEDGGASGDDDAGSHSHDADAGSHSHDADAGASDGGGGHAH